MKTNILIINHSRESQNAENIVLTRRSKSQYVKNYFNSCVISKNFYRRNISSWLKTSKKTDIVTKES